jgi:geranylgeranyl reductase family protein
MICYMIWCKSEEGGKELSDRLHDVIIVGAGPAGSHAAYALASSGYDVAVFEKENASGLNVCCTGIISTECFQSLGLDTDIILNQVSSAKFFSPSGKCLRVRTDKVQAYVVNRLLLDRALASKAQSRGARYFFSSPVTDVIPDTDRMQVETWCSGTREIFSSKAVILANGFKPKLPRKLGLGRINNFLVGAQVEVEAKEVDEFEVYFGQDVAPGAFAWLVPTSGSKVYVGLLATSQAKVHLQEFVNNLFDQGRIACREAPIEQKAVPIGTLNRSYGNSLLVIGDAAGQVKPTTGGGIYFGHLGAQIAAEVLDEALRSGNSTGGRLSLYQKRWKAKMGKELSRGYWARWAYSRLSDRRVEEIFNIFDSTGIAQSWLDSGKFSFDWHSGLILTGLRHSSVYPLLKIKHLFSREVGS